MKAYQTPQSEVLYVNVREQRVLFFLVFMGVLALTYGFLVLVDFLPEKPTQEADSGSLTTELIASSDVHTSSDSSGSVAPSVIGSSNGGDVGGDGTGTSIAETDRYPIKIIFDTLDREVKVLNPESRSIEALDTALLSGVVRHPDSGDFGRVGTILLFGHSSYLPNVINKNFQAFNGIQRLKWGDTVRLHSHDTEYVYQVERVYEASAADDSEIPIEKGKQKLTLVTCDSFGAKTDRFIVETTLVSTKPLET